MAVHGDAAEMVQAASAGVTVPPGDEAALGAAFQQLYRLEPERRRAMGQSGRAYYQSELALDRGAAALERLLVRLARC